MSLLKSLFLAAVAGAFAAFPVPSGATVATFTDRTSFDLAARPTSLIDFESFTAGDLCVSVFLGTDPCSFQTGGVEFVSTVSHGVHPPNLFSPQLQIANDTGLSKDLASAGIPMADGDFYLDLNASAVGFEVGSGMVGGQEILIEITDADHGVWHASTLAMATGTFVGFRSDVAIVKVSLFDGTGTLCCARMWIDDVAVAAIDEPQPLALLMPALASLFLARRRPPAGLRLWNGKRA